MHPTELNTASMRAKHPRSIIAGPYGHPFHPIVVIVPIATWVSAVVFDAIAIWGPEPAPFVQGGTLLIVIGLIGAALAAVLGIVDWSSIPRGTTAWTTGLTHMVLNLGAMGIFAVSLLLRLGTDELPILAVVCDVGAVLLLAVSGWLGGKLAHTYGVRVATETTQAEGLEQLP